MLQLGQSPFNQCPRNTQSIMMGFHSFGYLQSAESLVIPKPKICFLLVVALTDLNPAESTEAWPEKDWICQCPLPIAVLTQHQASHFTSAAFSLMAFFHTPCWCDTTPPGLTDASATVEAGAVIHGACDGS